MILNLEKKPVTWLVENIVKPNLAEDLDDNTLQKIGADVVAMYEVDKASRSDWEQRIEAGMKVAKQIVETKTFPWPGAANTKDALIAEAAAQFAARAGSEIVRGQDVVKVKVTGEDPQGLKEARAKRVGTYMSYECTDLMEEWESENDQLLASVSIIGMYYKKTYHDPMLGRSVSLAKSPMNIVVHDDTKSLSTARRITDDSLYFTKDEVIERNRKGLWLDVTEHMDVDEEDKAEMFLEQHRYLDLDGDGYQEPYVVTVHADSKRVCRIVARYKETGIEADGDKVIRITPWQYFTEFPFMLSPDGRFHKIGWAHLLGPNTETINTIVNQLLDAGTLANVPPVFMGRGAKLPPGGIKVQPGKINQVDSNGVALRDNIFVPQLIGPSDVLFNLLGLLTERGQRLANMTDQMQGETGGQNVPATTTLALLDQALKVYTSILKRLFRAYKQEFQKLYALCRENLTDKEYINVVDMSPEEAQEIGIDPAMVGMVGEESRLIVEKEFGENDKDIQPVMDPTASSEAIRLARLNAMAQAAGMPTNVGRIYLEGIGVPQKDIDAIFPPPEENAPPPPEMQVQMDMMKAELEKLKAQTVEIKAKSIKALADAEAAEIGTQVNIYKAEMEALGGVNGANTAGNQPGGPGGMEAQPDYEEGLGVPVPEMPAGGAGLGAGQLPARLPGAGGGLDIIALGGMQGLPNNAAPGQFLA